jgi:hypothetical protein
MIRRRGIRSGLTISVMMLAIPLAIAPPAAAQNEPPSSRPRVGTFGAAVTQWATSAERRFRTAVRTLGGEGVAERTARPAYVQPAYAEEPPLAPTLARTPRPRPEPDIALLPQADAAVPLPTPAPIPADLAQPLEAPEASRPPVAPPPPAAAQLAPAPAAADNVGAAASLSYPDAASAIETLARAPRPRPQPSSELLAMVAPDAPAEPPAPPPPPRISTVTDAEHAACLGRLRALGVAFTSEAPIDPTGSCNVDRPLNVSSVGSGVGIEPEAIMNCATAESLARWTAEIMLPAAQRLLDAKPQKIVHGSTYVCRPRNNVAGEELSEHAYANAVDISAIAFADREPFNVRELDEGEPEGKFQAAIREGSCSYFTTVLGPGSNAAHATHFHFDMAERGGGYRLCELGPAIASDDAPEFDAGKSDAALPPNTSRE